MKKIVVVVGMHRSGTSLAAKSLELVGYEFGSRMMPPNDDNPKGFWEDLDIVEFNEKLLRETYSLWDRPGLKAPEETIADIEVYLAQAVSLLEKKLLEVSHFIIKDPRFCLLLSFWQQVFDRVDASIQYVFIYRNPLDVAASLKARNDLEQSYSLDLWFYYSLSALEQLKEEFLVVGYSDLLNNTETAIEGIADYLNVVHPTGDALQNFRDNYVDEKLCNSSSSLKELHNINPKAFRLGEKLSALCLKRVDKGSVIIDAADVTSEEGLVAQFLWEQRKFDFHFIDTQRNKENYISIEEYSRLKLELNAELIRQDKEIKEQSRAISEQQLTMEGISTELAEKASWIALLQKELEEKQVQVDGYKEHYELLRDSFSFRVGKILTYPFRWIYRFISGVLFNGSHRAHVFLSFLRLCIIHPRKFFSLLSIKRINNVFVLLFKRPDLIEKVTGNYIEDFKAQEVGKFDKVDKINIDDISLSFIKHPSPVVSVIIPVYNQISFTINCLLSIKDALPKAPIEIIIADDCSTDRTEEIISKISGIKYIRHAENIGFLCSCNKAVEKATGQYVFLLNNDTAVTPGWLDSLLAVFEKNLDAGLVGSKLIYPDGRLQEAGGIIWDDASGWNYGRLDDASKPEYNYLKEVDYVSGAAILFTRELFSQTGGFDERYVPAYYEDADLAFEVRRLGKKVYLQPSSVVVHFEGVSNGVDTSSGIKKYQLDNQEKFLEKWSLELQRDHYSNGDDVFLARDRSLHKKTVLVIDHYVPHFDQDAGSKSTYLYIQLLLSEGYSVKFLGDNFYQHEPYTSVLQQMGVEVIYGEYYRKHWKVWLRENYKHIDYIYMIRPHVAEKYIDIIRGLPSPPKTIYFGCDLHYLRLRRQYEIEGAPNLIKEADEWEKRENALFEKMDVIYYPSIVEVNEIKTNFPDLYIKAIPLYVFDEIPDIDKGFIGDDLLFVGGFAHQPNEDGLIWFCNEIFPIVREAIPDIRLHVVGSSMPESISNLACEHVITHGFLSEQKLDELYSTVRMSVVPLRFGAGVKGKVLEAMYKGIPLATTSVGAEGIPEADSCMLICDDSESFAKELIEVYRSEPALLEQRQRAQQAIKRYFSRDAVLEIIQTDFTTR